MKDRGCTNRVYFYHAEGCDLCERMYQQLVDFTAGPGSVFGMEIVSRDVEDNPEWVRLYREFVPVLVVNGEEVCHYFFDGNALLRALSKS